MATTLGKRAPAPVKSIQKAIKKVFKTGKKKKKTVKPKPATKPAKKPAKAPATKSTLKKLIKEIKSGNSKFDSMTKAQKRVKIAKDVIKQLTAKKIEASTGVYVEGPDDEAYNYLQDMKGQQFKKVLSQPGITCKACGIGSMLVCDIMERNKYKITDLGIIGLDSRELATKRLKKYFPELQLDLIEAAFEMKVIRDSKEVLTIEGWREEPTELGLRAIKFGEQYDESEPRLVAIMQNIIKNKGTFIP